LFSYRTTASSRVALPSRGIWVSGLIGYSNILRESRCRCFFLRCLHWNSLFPNQRSELPYILQSRVAHFTENSDCYLSAGTFSNSLHILVRVVSQAMLVVLGLPFSVLDRYRVPPLATLVSVQRDHVWARLPVLVLVPDDLIQV
jgi:hypothetical protein